MGIVNIIFDTIDVLYDVAHKINSLNFIQILENVDNSPFTKIFNAFFILAFALLFLFAVWKVTFRILDADTNEQPMFELVKEIVKCGFLIFGVYLIFNTTINLGINLSNAVYNQFNIGNSTIGDNMKTSYLTINEACYKIDGGEDEDKDNVKKLKEKQEMRILLCSAKENQYIFLNLINELAEEYVNKYIMQDKRGRRKSIILKRENNNKDEQGKRTNKNNCGCS